MKKFVKRPVLAQTDTERAEEFLDYLVNEQNIDPYDLIVDGFINYLPQGQGYRILDRYALEHDIPLGKFA